MLFFLLAISCIVESGLAQDLISTANNSLRLKRRTKYRSPTFVPIYRFNVLGDHGYTLDKKEIEKNGLLTFEGVFCDVIDPKKARRADCRSIKPLYRLYKSMVDHMVSDDSRERGYVNEGKVGFVAKRRRECGANVPIYRFKQRSGNDHLLGNTRKPEHPAYVLEFKQPIGYCWKHDDRYDDDDDRYDDRYGDDDRYDDGRYDGYDDDRYDVYDDDRYDGYDDDRYDRWGKPR